MDKQGITPPLAVSLKTLQEITTMPLSLQMNHSRRLATQTVSVFHHRYNPSRACFTRLDSCMRSARVAWGHVAGSFSSWVSIHALALLKVLKQEMRCWQDEVGSRDRSSNLGEAAMYKNHLMRRFKYGTQQGKKKRKSSQCCSNHVQSPDRSIKQMEEKREAGLLLFSASRICGRSCEKEK